MRRRRALLVAMFFVVIMPASSSAQGLRSRIAELFSFGDCADPLCLDGSVNAQNGHGQHFIPAALGGNETIISFILDAIGTNVSNIPLGATSSGATFTLVGGLPVKTSESSGPIFGERAQTLGRGRLVVGANMSAMSFSSLRGTSLDDLVFNFTHQDVGTPGLGSPAFENDFIEVRTSMSLNLIVASFYATYGVTDRFDIGVAVPLVHTSFRGESDAQIVTFSTAPLHFFSGTSTNPVLTASTHASGNATGLGDVAVRAKLNLNRSARASFSVLAEGHLPTGDEDDLLGAGGWALRGLGVYSARFGDFSPHFNFGGVHRSGDRQTSALIANAGFDQLLAPWATFAFDILSEWQLGESALEIPEPVVYSFPFARTVQPTNIEDRRDDLIGLSVGTKLRMDSGATGILNMLVPIGQGGLRPRAVWTAGLEYNF
ncbi:MAG TPA: transporter [Gemmatimonadaceae bacterium]|nr:transporter [Gemmatimonadaceae bacterium]